MFSKPISVSQMFNYGGKNAEPWASWRNSVEFPGSAFLKYFVLHFVASILLVAIFVDVIITTTKSWEEVAVLFAVFRSAPVTYLIVKLATSNCSTRGDRLRTFIEPIAAKYCCQLRLIVGLRARY